MPALPPQLECTWGAPETVDDFPGKSGEGEDSSPVVLVRPSKDYVVDKVIDAVKAGTLSDVRVNVAVPVEVALSCELKVRGAPSARVVPTGGSCSSARSL